MPARAIALALAVLLVGAPGEATQPAQSGASASGARDPIAEALRNLSDAVPPEGSPAPDAATAARLCERWLEFTREVAREDRDRETLRTTDWKGTRVVSPFEYSWFARQHLRDFGSMGPEMKVAHEIAEKMMAWKIPCPPTVEQPGTGSAKLSISPWLIVGLSGAAAGVVAVAAGGAGSRTTTSDTASPAAQPPDVSSLHGMYNGRLLTAASTISGCGRAATAPCNATLGGSANGTPATLTFGGDLASTGVLRQNGTLENLSYQGPANGLGALPAGVVIQWLQQGGVTNGVLRLEGRATVTSSGPCNGAVIPTTVEATKN